jgi:hypothetical protein
MIPTDPSFEKINYSLRPNKNVQRKLIANLLDHVLHSPQLRDLEYRYIGMGSPWFSDFVLMHRVLGIRDMISMERQVNRAKRMKFNRPFSNIKIRIGSTTEILPTIGFKKPTIIWLDYDDHLKDYMFEDVDLTLRKLEKGSVIVITVNAEFSQLQNVKEEGKVLDPAEVLRMIAGDATPNPLKNRLNNNHFPSVVGEILSNTIRSKLLLRGLDYYSFFNFFYKDGARMVTVGGMIVDSGLVEVLDRMNLRVRFPWIAENGQASLQLPHLTVKEKMRFDELLPAKRPPSNTKLGFELKPLEAQQYWQHYLLYPVFAEWLP